MSSPEQVTIAQCLPVGQGPLMLRHSKHVLSLVEGYERGEVLRLDVQNNRRNQ